MVPILYRAVPDHEVPEAVAKYQRIDFSGADGFDSNIAKLTAALDADLDWKETHTRLLTRAKEWEQQEKDSSFLLRGKDLLEAEEWLAKSAEKEPKPTTLHSQYVLASRQSTTRRQRIIIGAVSVAFLIAVGLATYAFWEAAMARARQLAQARSPIRRPILSFRCSSPPKPCALPGRGATSFFRKRKTNCTAQSCPRT
jgi:hypothetical protein